MVVLGVGALSWLGFPVPSGLFCLRVSRVLVCVKRRNEISRVCGHAWFTPSPQCSVCARGPRGLSTESGPRVVTCLLCVAPECVLHAAFCSALVRLGPTVVRVCAVGSLLPGRVASEPGAWGSWCWQQTVWLPWHFPSVDRVGFPLWGRPWSSVCLCSC